MLTLLCNTLLSRPQMRVVDYFRCFWQFSRGWGEARRYKTVAFWRAPIGTCRFASYLFSRRLLRRNPLIVIGSLQRAQVRMALMFTCLNRRWVMSSIQSEVRFRCLRMNSCIRLRMDITLNSLDISFTVITRILTGHRGFIFKLGLFISYFRKSKQQFMLLLKNIKIIFEYF